MIAATIVQITFGCWLTVLVDAQCTTITGTDFRGNDLKGRSTARTPEACCSDCAKTPGCTAWTLWVGGPSCYLKHNDSGRIAAQGHVSGTVANPLPPLPDTSALVNATDCEMRTLIVEYAISVNTNINADKARVMIAALEGDPKMGTGCRINSSWAELHSLKSQSKNITSKVRHQNRPSFTVYADSIHGNDSATGTENAPFKTIQRAIEAVRSANVGGGVVSLREGVFHVQEPITLSAADSNLVIETSSADAGIAWVSGATPLTNVTWRASNISNGANIWTADLSALDIVDVPALRWQGRRLWRARYPNGDPETTHPFEANVFATAWLPSRGIYPPIAHIRAPSNTSRNDTLTDSAYGMVVGGSACSKYSPPIANFCEVSDNKDAGGGVVINQSVLPNLPYANPLGATITAMHHGLWCSFSYRVGPDKAVNDSNSLNTSSFYTWSSDNHTATLQFDTGGQQCNRPESVHGQLLIEGVLEELDAPCEFHFNTSTKVLTLWHNATSGSRPPVDGTLEVVRHTVLLNATGTRDSPVRALRLHRVGFRDTASTSFHPHVAPTGGDWAVNRAAAVTVAGAEGFEVRNATFWRLDNAGVFLGGYHRNAVLADNEFAWLGESAIVSLGDTEGVGFEEYPGFGYDGSAGNQPRGTQIQRNFAREIGIVNKQSAMFFQAATSNTTVAGNVVFNGARSGINFNDCFGTGSHVSGNVMFNLNRETADHGCFNSWDRLPFYPSKGPAHRDVLYRNLALVNYNSYNGLDTDDNSAYFFMKSNVLHYGHVLKSDFSGHSIEYDGDLGVFVESSNQYQPVRPQFLNVLRNCTIITQRDGDNVFSLTSATCNGTTQDFPQIENIRVFSPSGISTICGTAVATLEAEGRVKNISTAMLPDTASVIVQRARGVLGLP